ncbi:MAG TPA: PAS domain S-box protein [Thermoanaerobaculia bacterium]|nr:PAS domain S-box protein [Thermoanaerobaculia bacterium]
MSSEQFVSAAASREVGGVPRRVRLESALSRLPAAAYMCDADGLITYFNSRAAAIWGREPKLNHPDDRFCGSFKLFDADGRPVSHSECWMALALREGRDFNGNAISIERPDGRRVDALAFVNPIFDDQGRVLGALNVVVDITEQRRSHAPAGESVETRQLLIEASPVPIVVIDPDPPIVRFWNPAAQGLFGWTADEVVGKPIPIVPEEKRVESASHRALVARGDSFPNLETYRLTKSGQRVDVSMSAAPLRSATGSIDGVLLLFADLTERKRAERELKEADRAKNEFLATLAHELRNPLSPIRNATEILRLRGAASPELDWALEIIERQMQHMTRLVDDLLDVSRITMNRLELRKERIEIGEIIKDAVEASRPILEQCEHRLTVTADPRVVVDADRERLAQVLANLLHNAAKYTERGGIILLTAARERDNAVIVVRDTGIGIPDDKLATIFEMFTQLNPVFERAQSGLGIGLTLARRLVHLHGGTIEARSAGAGRGSEFTIRIPVAQTRQDEERPRAAAQRALRRTALRVLVVDDKEDSAKSLGMLLEMTGNEVRMAHDGSAAVAEAAAFRPHAVLLDIGMPRMNGYDAARAIRSERWGRDIYLIALTGWGQEIDRFRSREAGFDLHLVKPVAPGEILDRLAALERSLGMEFPGRSVEH